MREPVWLLESVMEAAHLQQLAEHGGPSGVRDPHLLSSALARPRQVFAYGDGVDLAALAAAYAHGIARNHPFVDGNKRTALIALLLFLRLNGQDLTAPPMDRYLMTMALAAGDLNETQLADWIRSRLQPFSAP
jgi:death-on-curing protein